VLESAREPESDSGRFGLYHALSAALVVVSVVVFLAAR
jgi:hypothetical protein